MSASKAGTAIQDHRIAVEEALARVPGPKGERFADVFKHGSLSVEIFAPRGVDNQQPHTRDEVYVVVHGSGRFAFGNERVTFGPGDFLFVPAGVAHRFVRTSPKTLSCGFCSILWAGGRRKPLGADPERWLTTTRFARR